LSFAIANYVGGKIATLTGGHGGGGEELDAAAGLATYTGVFSNIGFVLLAISVLLMLFSKPLEKLMHGVK